MNTADRIEGATVWTVSKSAVGCEVGGEMVLLDLNSGTYFGMNAVGAEIWRQLNLGRSFDEIQQHLLERYRVSAQQCESEVLAFVGVLSQRGLIRNGSDEASL